MRRTSVPSEPDPSIQERMQQIESLLAAIEASTDPKTRDACREVVRLLMDLHGAGLAAMLEEAAGFPGGHALIDAWAGDELISSMMMLYGLHPVGVETRARAALDSARPLLQAHGCEAELLSVDDGVARLRLTGDVDDPGLVRSAVEEAFTSAAPDLTRLEIEGPAGASRLVSLPLVGR